MLNDTPSNPSNSGLPSTSQVFADATEVIVVGHATSDTIFVPKEPIEIAQYESTLFKEFIDLQPSVTVISEVDKTAGDTTIKNYAIEFPAFGLVTDIRVRM